MKRLSESFIDDVIRRSRNNEEREEDGVNLMDSETFCDFLKSRYTVTGKSGSSDAIEYNTWDNYYKGKIETITLKFGPREGCVWIRFNYMKGDFNSYRIGPKDMIDFEYHELSDELKTEYPELEFNEYSYIYTKSITNKEIVSIIDLIVDMLPNSIIKR